MNFFLAKQDITICTCSANLPFYKRQTDSSTVDENQEKSESAYILGILCLSSFVYKAPFLCSFTLWFATGRFAQNMPIIASCLGSRDKRSNYVVFICL